MLQLMPQHILSLFQGAKVLLVDHEFYSRKVVRTLLMAMGINNIYDADSGAKAARDSRRSAGRGPGRLGNAGHGRRRLFQGRA